MKFKDISHIKFLNVKDDERTMDIIQRIANSIEENIQVTYDVPSNYKDGKITILDVKAGINLQNKLNSNFTRNQ